MRDPKFSAEFEAVSQNTEQNRGIHPNSLANLKPFEKDDPRINRGGRPKKKLVDRALEELLEEMDSAKAVEIAKALIAKALKGDTKAAQLVAERTEGKPMQKIEHSGSEGGPIQNEFRIRFVGD